MTPHGPATKLRKGIVKKSGNWLAPRGIAKKMREMSSNIAEKGRQKVREKGVVSRGPVKKCGKRLSKSADMSWLPVGSSNVWGHCQLVGVSKGFNRVSLFFAGWPEREFLFGICHEGGFPHPVGEKCAPNLRMARRKQKN